MTAGTVECVDIKQQSMYTSGFDQTYFLTSLGKRQTRKQTEVTPDSQGYETLYASN